LNSTPVQFSLKSSSPVVIEAKLNQNGTEKTIEAESVLVATGRKPNVANLGLEAAGVDFNEADGILVNDYLQSSNSDVYAVGDCCSKYLFTHNSDIHARYVIKNALFFGKNKKSQILLPWCTYTGKIN